MKLYRNHYSVEGGGSGGFSWHRSKRDAQLAARDSVKKGSEPPHTIAEVFITSGTKRELIRLLTRVATHNDNG